MFHSFRDTTIVFQPKLRVGMQVAAYIKCVCI